MVSPVIRNPYLRTPAPPAGTVVMPSSPPAADVSNLPSSAREKGFVVGSAALIAVLLPGSLAGGTTAAPAPPRESVSLAMTVIESRIPTVAAIPYLHADTPEMQPAIRTEMLGPTGSEAQANALLERYTANEPLIASMLVAEPAQADAIKRDLGIVPTPLVRKVAEAGTRIWAVPAGVTAVPVNLVPARGRTLDQVRAAWQSASSDSGWVSGPSPMLLTVKPSAPAAVPAAGSADMLEGYPWAGQTPEDLARFQGFTQSEETKSFVRLMTQMNPGVRAGKPLASGASLWVPDVFLYQGQRLTPDTWNDVAFINHSLEKYTIDGLYVAGQNLIIVLDETLADPSPVQGHHRIVLHEFAHAADYLTSIGPFGGEHKKTLQTLHDAASAGQISFITDYARTNTAEHYADAFEAYFTADRDDSANARLPLNHDGSFFSLVAREPDMARLIAADIEHAEDSAEVSISSESTPNGPTHVDVRRHR